MRCLGIYLATAQLIYTLGLLSHICFLFHLMPGTFSFWQASREALQEPVHCSLRSGEDCTGNVILDWIFPAFSSWEINLLRWLALPWATKKPLPGSLCTTRLWFELGFFQQKLGVLWSRSLQRGAGCYIGACSVAKVSMVLLTPVLRAQRLPLCWAIWTGKETGPFFTSHSLKQRLVHKVSCFNPNSFSMASSRRPTRTDSIKVFLGNPPRDSAWWTAQLFIHSLRTTDLPESN